jgi:branched-chain amino acid transport system substrate-binding protein
MAPLTTLRVRRSFGAPRERSVRRMGAESEDAMKRSRTRVVVAVMLVTLVLAGAGAFTARAADPIKIGFGIALTGGLSANGKPALLAIQIWKDDVNKKGGLLGRPVELVFYDDQTNPSTVPGIYTKLLDVDKVDLIISGYGTNLIAPLLPIAMERKLTIMGMLGLANNEKYQYPNYFQIQPAGPDPQISTAIGFFELAAKQTPKPQTVALVGADAEYPQNALVGARELAKKFGFKVVYDRTYPPSTADYTPIVRAIKATNPDIVFVASYPPDSVGMLRASHEVGLQPKMLGGGMVGLQFTTIMASMGPMLNGIVNYDFWAPEPSLMSYPGIKEFLKDYQSRAEKAGVDPLGYYLPPYAYSAVQILGQAVEATKSLDQQKIADHIRGTQFNTIVGPIKFGKNGEWARARTLMVQYQKVQGTSIDQFRGPGKKVVLYPEELKSGTIIYPYAAALK